MSDVSVAMRSCRELDGRLVVKLVCLQPRLAYLPSAVGRSPLRRCLGARQSVSFDGIARFCSENTVTSTQTSAQQRGGCCGLEQGFSGRVGPQVRILSKIAHTQRFLGRLPRLDL